VQTILAANISDTSDTSLAKINSRLLDSLQRFKKQIALKSASADTFMRTFPMAEIHYVKYDVAFCKNNLLSIVFNIYTYSGGAHGYGFLKPFTFNTLTGKIVEISSDLKPSKKDSFYIIEKKEALRQYGKQMFDSTLFTKFISGGKSKLRPDDTLIYNTVYNKDLYLSDSGIVSIYNPYEIAPYVSGILSVQIPFQKVKDFFNSESEVAAFLKK
jgi:hypothetical protein